MKQYEVIVVGAGPAGEVCAGQIATEGVEVALVERELVGGECSFWACMPAKALLRPAALLAELGRVPGVNGDGDGGLDARAVLARRDEVIHDLDDAAQLPWVQDRGITLIRGEARLDGERRVRVGDELLEARRAVVVAVGSGAAIPPIPGLREIAPWTNRAATTAKAVPGRLTVLGGGAVGCEMSQAWRSRGAEVPLIESQPQLLTGEEPFASEQLADSLRAQGVDVRLGATATAAAREGNEFVLTLDDGDAIRSDELLVAVGRRPHTDGLRLDSVGLKPGETIPVDDRMRVPGHDWLFAVGDVNGRALLTHAGKYQARVACAVIMNRAARAQWDGPLSPRVIFTDPQIAAVGLTFEAALAAGLPARAVDTDPEATPGGSFVGRGATAQARLVIDEQRRVIVGATFSGPDVAEWLHGVTIAIVGEVPLERLIHVIPAFPTRSEIWLRLLSEWDF